MSRSDEWLAIRDEWASVAMQAGPGRMAEAMGITDRHVRRLIHGENTPQERTIERAREGIEKCRQQN